MSTDPVDLPIPIRPIVFSAPFGNYLGGPNVTSTLGTFTLQHRAGWIGRAWRIVKTVRWSMTTGAWVNRLGLPNPGIDFALGPGRKKLAGRLLSVHGFNEADWHALFEKLASLPAPGSQDGEAGPIGVELNVSCPNVRDDPTDYAGLFAAAMQLPVPVVVKIAPVGWEPIVEAAVNAGVPAIHACNTIPVPQGGLSGKPLQPISLRVVAALRDRYAGLQIIGGGGVTSKADVDRYRDAGANHVAVASGLFFPWRIGRFQRIAAALSR